jgi:hypothetical protein
MGKAAYIRADTTDPDPRDDSYLERMGEFGVLDQIKLTLISPPSTAVRTRSPTKGSRSMR